jgi:hypothetical protein
LGLHAVLDERGALGVRGREAIELTDLGRRKVTDSLL